jgi:serine protease Do
MRKFVLSMLGVCAGLAAVQAEAYEGAEQGLEQLQQISDAFASVAAKVNPAVVAIVTEKTVRAVARDPFGGTPHPFEQFFGPRDFQRQEDAPRKGQGSGIIVRYGDGYYILTNNHVIKDADEIQIELADERYFDAEIVGADSLSDLAVLRVDADDLPAVPLGDSDELKVGQWVLAVGNPFGLEHTVTSGIVSALGRGRFSIHEYGSFIQTDAAINPGNSGGPLVNLRGEVVGINTAIVSSRSSRREDAQSAGLGFSIPVNLARDVLGQLVEHGEVRRGLLGVGIKDVDPVLAEALGMENTQGVLIEAVVQDGAADKAGVKQGDVIVEVDRQPVGNTTELKSRIGATPPGTRVELRLIRDGKEKKINVVLDQLTKDSFAVRPLTPYSEGKLGLTVQELPPELARRLGYEGENGVLITQVSRSSVAARQGLQRGDLIQEIERRPVETLEDYEEALEEIEDGDAFLMVVRRAKDTTYVALRMPEE